MNRRLLRVGAVRRLAVVLSVSLASLRGGNRERVRCAHVPRSAASSGAAPAGEHELEQQLVRLQPGHARAGQQAVQLDHRRLDRSDGDPAHGRQAEDSSDWIGIGGGCIDAGCTATDSTLIQTGTEQDVDSTGAASYSAWWELVPAPSLTISNMTVAPGDHMHASISEVVPDSDVWTITLQDVTRGESFTRQTVPYPPPTPPLSGSRRRRSRSAPTLASRRCRT